MACRISISRANKSDHASDCLRESRLRHATTIQLDFSEGIKQTHDEVDQRILEELTGRVYYDIRGFYERYFEGKV